MRIQGGFQDTRTNNEDFALTPFLFLVWISGQVISVYGFGLCWGYYSIYFGLGFNIPKNFPHFRFPSK